MCRSGRTVNLASGVSDIEHASEVNLSFDVHANSTVSAVDQRFLSDEIVTSTGSLFLLDYPLSSMHWS